MLELFTRLIHDLEQAFDETDGKEYDYGIHAINYLMSAYPEFARTQHAKWLKAHLRACMEASDAVRS